MDTKATLKPMYRFEWFEDADALERGDEPIRTRETASLENDNRSFRESGIELLAQFGRDDDTCMVTLLGFQQI